MINKFDFDIIVIGGGHAGIEASCISAKMGKKVCLVTLYVDKIGFMHCNPSVGGSAKGIVVREIDALGGVMGKAADATSLQFKLLNSSSGPAIQALRVQSDKMAYSSYMKNYVLNHNNIEVLEGIVEKIIVENNKVLGVKLSNGKEIFSKVVILTTGTYLKPITYKGSENKQEGPDGEKKVINGISQQLKEFGFDMKRFKTGTPPRILKDSIDYSVCKLEPGSNLPLKFSKLSKESDLISFKDQLPCYLIHTNEETHKIIRDNLHLSPICYKENIGKGPRYCPSIEDKILRFPDKDRHQVFLEPESRDLDTIYVQGISTSLPIDVQDKLVRSLPGLKNCVIKKWGYAIEYDVINANQLKLTLESKNIMNFFTAGQINGTSGYEEAAAQGLIAGINAVKNIENLEPFIIPRDKAYIGVLIDDLVTKENLEPYRLLTSRAEFRLLLRHDNVYSRLTSISHKNSLISDFEWEDFLKDMNKKDLIFSKLKSLSFSKDQIFNLFPKIKRDEFKNFEKISSYNLLKNQKIDLKDIEDFIEEISDLSWELRREIEIEVIYEDYVLKQFREVEKMNKYENKKIPLDFDYNLVHNIAAEAKEKLGKIRPSSIGQASRISGINPTDIQVLNFFLEKKFRF
ncbi:MAG: tRNA uridine 5-carboxymethylaminomethyl modification enzyme MnmG [Mycoplasmataceae bacterium]|nr:MAG: tRNA uridine 5-carboxymethylaminomethyl modification enzyme MnmG [Mycoplasmataceae bacterium]